MPWKYRPERITKRMILIAFVVIGAILIGITIARCAG